MKEMHTRRVERESTDHPNFNFSNYLNLKIHLYLFMKYMHMYMYELQIWHMWICTALTRGTHFQEEKTRHPLVRLPCRLAEPRVGSRVQRWMPHWIVSALKTEPNGSFRAGGWDRSEVSCPSCSAQNPLHLRMTLALQRSELLQWGLWSVMHGAWSRCCKQGTYFSSTLQTKDMP